MQQKHQYHTIKRRKQSPVGIILVVVFVLLIAVGGTVFGLLMVSTAVGDVVAKADVTLTCAVSGNDLTVEILQGGRADEVDYIELQLEGYNLPPGYGVKAVPDTGYPKKIVFTNMVAGIYGDLQVSFKAIFNDGSEKIIWMDTVKFT